MNIFNKIGQWLNLKGTKVTITPPKDAPSNVSRKRLDEIDKLSNDPKWIEAMKKMNEQEANKGKKRRKNK